MGLEPRPAEKGRLAMLEAKKGVVDQHDGTRDDGCPDQAGDQIVEHGLEPIHVRGLGSVGLVPQLSHQPPEGPEEPSDARDHRAVPAVRPIAHRPERDAGGKPEHRDLRIQRPAQRPHVFENSPTAPRTQAHRRFGGLSVFLAQTAPLCRDRVVHVRGGGIRLLGTIAPVADAERERRLLRLRAREQALTDELATIQEETEELEVGG